MAELVIKLVNGELAGKTAQSIAKEINAAAVAAKKAEVGTKEWVDAHARLDNAKKLQEDLTKQVKATTKASETLKSQFFGILNQIPGFSQLNGALISARGGVGGLTSGFGLLRGAIIATGLGALVIAIVGLVSWFAKTEKGANLLSGAFKGMGAVIDTLLNRLWNIGATLKQLFSDPIAFFKNLGNDIATAAKEGYELVQVFDDIEDRQREMEVRAKEQDILVDQLLLQAKNAGKTYQEKLDILEKADQITRESYKEQLALSKEYLDAVDREVAAAEKAGTMGDDLADKQKEAKLAYLNLVGQEIQIEEKIQNRRDQILEKREKADSKLSEAAKKKAEEELAIQQNIEDLKVQAMQEGIEKEIAQVELDTQRKIEALIGSEEQITLQKELLETDQQNRIQAIRDKFAAEQAAKDQKAIDEELKRQQKLGEDKKLLEQAKIDFERDIADMSADIAADSFAVTTEFAARRTKDEAAAKRIRKAGAVVDIGINLQREISAINANAAANPLNAVPGGSALVAAQTTAQTIRAIIRSAISVAKVIAFRRGGRLIGPSHEQNGIPFNINRQPGFEAEGDEILMTRGVWRNPGLRSMASAINVAGGGVAFASGGPMNPFSGSSSSRNANASANTADPFSAIQRLEDKFESYASRVDEWARTLRVENVATETEDVLKTVNAIKADADV